MLKNKDIGNELLNILNYPQKVSEILKKSKAMENQKDEKKRKKKKEEKENEPENAFSKVYGPPRIYSPYKKLTDETAEYLTKYRKIV